MNPNLENIDFSKYDAIVVHPNTYDRIKKSKGSRDAGGKLSEVLSCGLKLCSSETVSEDTFCLVNESQLSEMTLSQ